MQTKDSNQFTWIMFWIDIKLVLERILGIQKIAWGIVPVLSSEIIP